MVLDNGATNSVCPYKDQCFNIRTEENKMDCAGGNEIKIKLIGDMFIKARDKDMNSLNLTQINVMTAVQRHGKEG